ncbi:ribonuclease 3-like protein 2 isoform X1 [Castanea sativa]|uniref:ribonuclease 3-like protein 2 isoform X1 n=1 Tax=Castanea sativa TaxID=21020 RepID=UPI003F651123
MYSTYPSLSTEELSRLRDANISNKKLARVAVDRGLRPYIIHSAGTYLYKEIEKFAEVSREDGKVPIQKILADIVESLAAAIYDDLKFNLQKFWENSSLVVLYLKIFEKLLEPIVTLEDLPTNNVCDKKRWPKPIVRFELLYHE